MRKSRTYVLLALAAAAAITVSKPARADEVTDWNEVMIEASMAEHTPPFILTRSAAIVQAAVFDALNGIERRYQPIHVSERAPEDTSRRAAVVQAAYGTLVVLFPAQQSTLDAKRWAALDRIATDSRCTRCRSIDRGIEWGQEVADAILVWRSTDGSATSYPPFLGGTAPGIWRPTLPAFAPGAGVFLAHMTPWTLESPSQFRLDGPPALTSALYAADYNESMATGSATSLTRTADQTLLAQFWNGNTPTYLWGRLAISLLGQRDHSLLHSARLFAQLSLAMSDAAIACWDTKYTYTFWRPITAIALGADDGNPATMPDPSWMPLLATPNHPEYPSAHSTISTAAATVLASYFAEDTTITLDSSALPGVCRSFKNFSAALDEVADARVFGGIHFRNSCNQGRAQGKTVGAYVLSHSCRRLHRDDDDESDDEEQSASGDR